VTSGAATWRGGRVASTGSSRAPYAQRTRSLFGPLPDAAQSTCERRGPARHQPAADTRRLRARAGVDNKTTIPHPGRAATGRHRLESTARATAPAADRTARRTPPRTRTTNAPTSIRAAGRRRAAVASRRAPQTAPRSVPGATEDASASAGLRPAGTVGGSRKPPVGILLAEPTGERPCRAVERTERSAPSSSRRSSAERGRGLQRLSAAQWRRGLQPLSAAQRGRQLQPVSPRSGGEGSGGYRSRSGSESSEAPSRGPNAARHVLPERGRRLAGTLVAAARVHRVRADRDRVAMPRHASREPAVVPPGAADQGTPARAARGLAARRTAGHNRP